MKKNFITEVDRLKKLMLINEGSGIKWTFKDGLGDKITQKITSLEDTQIRSFNLESKKTVNGREITNKIDSKQKLLNELNLIKDTNIKYLDDTQKKFLKDLNTRLNDLDSTFIKDLATYLKTDFKSSDGLTQGQFLETYKTLLNDNEYKIFQKEIQGFTFKAGVLPVLTDIAKGVSNLAAPFLTGKLLYWVTLPTIVGMSLGILTPILMFINSLGAKAAENLNNAIITQGAKLFNLILSNKDTLTLNKSSEEIANLYGITDNNKTLIDGFVSDFKSTGDWFDTTEGELEDLIENITNNLDGINFLYFLVKFKEVANEEFMSFLMKEDFEQSTIKTIINNSVNANFKFVTIMEDQVTTIESIKVIMDALTSSYGGSDGYRQFQVALDSRLSLNELQWTGFRGNNPNAIITVINSDGEEVKFDYSTRLEILRDLELYINGVWSTEDKKNIIEKAKKSIGDVINDNKPPTEQELLSLRLNPDTVYFEVSNKLMKEHPEFNKVQFTWPVFQKKMNENIGLSRLLKEQPVFSGTQKKNSAKASNTATKPTSSQPNDCPPNVVDFQKWLNDTKKPWFNNTQFTGTLGTCGKATKDAWANQDWKKGYEEFKTSGGVTQPTPTNIESIDKDITDVAKNVTFYDTAGRLIQWLSYVNNNKFNIDAKMIEIVTLANRRKTGGDKPIIAYIKSVISNAGMPVAEIEVDENYKNDIESYINTKKRLNETTYLKPVIGLSKILLDEARIRYLIKNDEGKLFISGEKKSVNRDTLDSNSVISRYQNHDITYFKPLSLVSSGGLPDAAPLVGEVKKKLNQERYYNYTLEDNTIPNIFNKDLQTAIIQYKREKAITNQESLGEIDFYLVKSLFPDGFKKSTPETTPAVNNTTTAEIKLPNNFDQILIRANLINGKEGELNPVYFDNCRFIFNEYPKAVREYLKFKDIKNLPGPEKFNNNNKELESIKTAFKMCNAAKPIGTRTQQALDTVNIFNRGIQSIKNLESPFNIDIK
jgi:PKD repeat protein